MYEGKHNAIIEKRLFDKVQAVIAKRCHPQKGATAPQVFCGLLSCATCKMSITADKKTKHQKNGNTHEYVYYRCTRKHKTITCKELPVTEPDLAAQLSDILQGYALPESWAATLDKMLDEDKQKAEQSASVFVANAQTRLANLQSKLRRLLDGYLDQDIDQQTYRTRQGELMSEKKSLEEQISKLTLAGKAWIEPMHQWLKQAVSLCEIAKSGDSAAIKDAFLKIDGLNLFLSSKKAQPTAAQNSFLPPENIWLLLGKTKEKERWMRSNFPKSSFLVRIRGLESHSARKRLKPICFGLAGKTQTATGSLRLSVQALRQNKKSSLGLDSLFW